MAQEVMYETGNRKGKTTAARSANPAAQPEQEENRIGWEEQLWMNQAEEGDDAMGSAWQREGMSSSNENFDNISEQVGRVRGQIEGGFQSFWRNENFSFNGAWTEGQNLAEIKRWSALIGGGFLALFGLRRSLGSLALMGVGAGLISYALTGKWPLAGTTNRSRSGASLRGRTGSTSLDSNRPMAVKNIIVKAPLNAVYQTWANFENFPNFMQHIQSVTKTGDHTSHWIMEGPLHSRIEWDAETTRLEENKRIAWNSTSGDIKTSGQVTFNALPDNEVEVTVMLRYIPPAGVVGDLFATLFGDPEGKLAEDLRNFKRYIEQRKKNPEGTGA
ncbi:MAG: SRPBCC family protein [Caldilineaceae bacterium]